MSTNVPAVSDPHALLEFTALNSATLPLVALMAMVKVKSGVRGSAPPAALPVAPATSRYWQGWMVVPAGKVKMFGAELPQVPVADPYSMVQPPMFTAASLLLKIST